MITTDALGQTIHRGDSIAYIVYGGRYGSGSVARGVAVDVMPTQVRIIKESSASSSVVGSSKVLVLRGRVKLSDFVMKKGGLLWRLKAKMLN